MKTQTIAELTKCGYWAQKKFFSHHFTSMETNNS